MKAIRTVEGLAVNPVFSAAQRRAVTAENQPYDVPEFIVMPVGQELSCPDCWRLCVKGLAVPDDDECRAKFFEVVGDPGRKAITEQIFLLRTAAKTSKLSDAEQRHLSQLEKAYAVDLKLAEEQKANALSGMDPATGIESAGSSDAGSSSGGGGTPGANPTKPAKDQTSSKGKA
jgi:hypothetical protein